MGPLLFSPRAVAGALGAAALATTGALWGIQEFVLLAIVIGVGLVIGLVHVLVASWSSAHRCQVFVRLSSAEVAVGSPLYVEMEVVAPVRRWIALRLEDPGWHWALLQDPEAPLPRRYTGRLWVAHSMVAILGSRVDGAMSYRQELDTVQRGQFTIDGPRLWCTDSFGLFARVLARAPASIVSVQPLPTAPAIPLELPGELARDEHTSERAPATLGLPDASTDLTGLRAYVPGDRLRLLHWPTLARTGELVVRDFEPLGPHRILVVVDTRVALLGRVGVEAVIGAAAGFTGSLLDRGSSVELWTTTGQLVVSASGQGGKKAVLRSLAALDLYRRRTRRRSRGSNDATRADAEWSTRPFTVGARPVTITTPDGAPSFGHGGRLVIVS